jgi:hypothetical protein
MVLDSLLSNRCNGVSTVDPRERERKGEREKGGEREGGREREREEGGGVG